MKTILALDPGPTKTAYVLLHDGWVRNYGIKPNEEVLVYVRKRYLSPADLTSGGTTVCEWIQSYGMAVGAETFETCRWVGRFQQACMGQWHELTRPAIKLHLCGTPRAKDANVRRVLLDRFGGDAAGKKGGPLYGVRTHLWAALAVAVAWHEINVGPIAVTLAAGEAR